MKPAPSVHLPNSTERTMQYRHTMLYLLATLACSQAQAWSRMAYAEVSLVNGLPCFSISKKEEKRNGIPQIGALNVSDLSVKPAIKIWSFILPGAESIPVRANSCIRYGTAPAGAETRTAPPLKTGRLYDVFLNGRPNDPADPTQGYVGKFCLTAKAGGGHELVVVTSDMREWRDEVCPGASPSQ
ncbi:hypothetical protein [Janthinobacterium sp. J1-1]|uniref:hypothetical protein n=1 Tax=Janthinobacterium sp. J1-1 TaxID=3065910 RepID=UPI002810F28E|nr:hypothetical protein [Janthinobacterium sp. J1-1]